MTVREIFRKFQEFETSVSKEKGAFAFFALFLRGEMPDRWDLIVAAPWAANDRYAAVEYLGEAIKTYLGDQYLLCVSRIIVIDPQNPDVQAVIREFEVEHGGVEVRDDTFFGQLIKRAFIITSKLPPAPAAA